MAFSLFCHCSFIGFRPANANQWVFNVGEAGGNKTQSMARYRPPAIATKNGFCIVSSLIYRFSTPQTMSFQGQSAH